MDHTRPYVVFAGHIKAGDRITRDGRTRVVASVGVVNALAFVDFADGTGFCIGSAFGVRVERDVAR